MTSGALDRTRVAELIVTHSAGRRRGSGYRVAAGAILTAAHVLEDAEAVSVRFEADLPGEWSTHAVSWWSDPGSDVAVVSIDPPSGEVTLSPARFGRIRDAAAVLSIRAVGFPRWKLRDDENGCGRYRDAYQAEGSLPVLSNWREGTLELVVSPGPASDAVSPWEGMSGAAVWVGDRIVAVVSKHHPSDGLTRLAAARLDRALDSLDQARWAELREVLPVPEGPGQWPDVVPRPAREVITTAYRAQVADITPDQLYDRDWELAELVRFCAGEDQYCWWQAGPWAGKSALLSWFALHPPAGVEIVSFFVTSRFAGQSDSDAFTDAAIEQLAALAGESPQTALEARARSGHLLRLLETAAERCAEIGHRLLLIVDGLDEDTSRASDIDRPSIASLLPRRPPSAVRVLVASRPSPELSDDVFSDHPLRMIAPRTLTVSAHARGVERAAKNELTRLLNGPEVQRDILGLITASAGGLTRGDLEELTGRPPYEIDELMSGVFGRTVGSRFSSYGAERSTERAYLFAHETLRETAEQRYGASLNAYRDRLHTWAESYRARGWPSDTPVYLIRGYSRLLAARGDVTRLLACATDRARHDRMLAVTGGDALGLSELKTTVDLVSQQQEPDFGGLLLLAIARDALVERNRLVPAELPAVWAELGQPARATALAHGITEADRRAQALVEVAAALQEQGQRARALEVATAAEVATGEVADTEIYNRTRGELAIVLASIGKHEIAAEIANELTAFAREISDSGSRAEALSERVAVWAGIGDSDRVVELAAEAEAAAHEITSASHRERLLAKLTASLAATGHVSVAERIARDISDAESRVPALTEVAAAFASAGDAERAAQWAADAEVGIPKVMNRRTQTDLLGRLAKVWMRIGDHPKATDRIATAQLSAHKITHAALLPETLGEVAKAWFELGEHAKATEAATAAVTAAYATNDDLRDGVWGKLVTVLAAAGHYDRARRYADEIGDTGSRAQALTEAAAAMVVAGKRDLAAVSATAAETAARESTGSRLRDRTLGCLAGALAHCGDCARSEALAYAIDDAQRRSAAITEIAVALARVGDYDRSIRLARDVTGDHRVRTLAAVGEVLAAAGEHELLARIAAEVETIADGLTDERVSSPSEVAVALVRVGSYERALSLAYDFVVRVTRVETLAGMLAKVASVLADAGQYDRAVKAVEAADSAKAEYRLSDRDRSALVSALVRVGRCDRALMHAHSIDYDNWRVEALAEVVRVLGAAGEHARAERIARELEHPAERACALAEVATELVAAEKYRPASKMAADAELIATEITDADNRFQALVGVAHAWAATGDYERAEQLIRDNIESNDRTRELGNLASIIADRGDCPEQSTEGRSSLLHRIIPEILSTSAWVSVLPAVGRITPSAIQRAADVVLERTTLSLQPGQAE